MSVVNIPQNCWLFFLVINFLAVKVEIDKWNNAIIHIFLEYVNQDSKYIEWRQVVSVMQLYFSIGKRCRRKANWSPYVPIYKIFPKRIILLKFDDIRYCTNSGWLHLFFREWPDVRKIEIKMNKIKLYQWFINFWNDKDIN